MDTPERSQIAGTPLSKFEDSPLFNFINNLSPIQPVKSAHSVQAYTSPGFTSISSVFSSPHVNLQKESRFSLRQTYSESSKQENSSDSGNESTRISNAVKLSGCIVVAKENCNIKCSFNEAALEPPDDCSTIPSNLPQSMQYDCGSPNHNITPCYGSKLDLKLDVGCKQVELVQFSEDGLDGTKSLFAAEIVRGKHLTEQAKEEVPGCDWKSLISNDADDLFIFEESTGSETCEGQDTILGNKNANFRTSFSAKLTEDVVDDSQKTQPDASFAPCLEKNMQDRPVIRNLEVGEQDETDHAPQMFADVCQNQIVLSTQRQKTGNGTSASVPFDSKVDSPQQRGMRRRCLFFEASGVSKRNLHNATNLHNLNPLPSKNKFSYDSRLASFKPGASPSPFLLPGIGLHLNTLATTSKDKMVTQETLASGRQVISMPCSIGPFPPTTSSQKSLDKSLSIEKDVGTTGSEVQELQIMQDDAGRALDLGSTEELSQSSPKKKRRKSETGGESEACKRCNCKKSKCLKLYCECFAAGVFCSEPCSCQGCYNKPIHEETVLVTRKQIESRNPLAFAPKVIRTSETFQDMGEEANKTPASARHKRGCNCKKSSCLKKYCECYQSGVGCSINCRCEGCKNAFGRKDGVEEPEPGEEEMNACETEKDKPDAGQENADVKKDEHHFSESILLATPLQICSASVKLPFFSIGKPPRSSTPPIGCTPLLNTCRMLKKSEIPLPQRKFGKHISTVPEDDAPEFLSCNGSPDNCVKTSSPNGKRVSPPHSGTGPSPSRKGGRKLILKSIPSFPSLNIDAADECQAKHCNSQFSSAALN